MRPWLLLLLIAAPALLHGQAPSAQTPLAFEVASVKTNTSGGPSRGRVQPGRFSGENVTLLTILRQAFDVLPDQIDNVPDWVSSDRYDIVAKAPDGADFPGTLAPMLRNLLAERFHLRAHTESRTRPVYELVTARSDRPSRTKADAVLRGLHDEHDESCASDRKGREPTATIV